MAATAPPDWFNTTKETARLKDVFVSFLGIEEATYDDDPIVRALANAGVTGFFNHFIMLNPDAIDGLIIPPSSTHTTARHLNVAQSNLLKMTLGYFHHVSRKRGRVVDISKIPKELFDEYRLVAYDPTNPIIPWMNPLPASKVTQAEKDVNDWARIVKPSKSDYKELKDEAYWIQWLETFCTTIESQGLQHLVTDPDAATFVPPTNTILDKKQQSWLFSVWETVLKSSTTKSMLKDHSMNKDTMNTRRFWKDLTTKMSTSIAAEVKAQSISTYLTSVRLVNSDWRGTHEQFILHFAEQARLHSKIDPEAPFTDKQLVTLLSTAVTGIPHLANIRNLHRLASKGKPLTFADFVSQLQDAAQTYDAGNKRTTNPRVRQSVNAHDFSAFSTIFEEEAPQEVNVHNHEVLFEHEDGKYVVNATDFSGKGGPRRVRMDFETWKSLTDEDRTSWDKVSDDGKRKILKYAANRSSNNNNETARNPNSSRSINSHLIFDDKENSGHTMEAQIHSQSMKHTPPPDLLDMATTKTSNANQDAYAGVHIANIMSSNKPSKPTHSTNITTHEFVKRNHAPMLEFNMHERGPFSSRDTGDTHSRDNSEEREARRDRDYDARLGVFSPTDESWGDVSSNYRDTMRRLLGPDDTTESPQVETDYATTTAEVSEATTLGDFVSRPQINTNSTLGFATLDDFLRATEDDPDPITMPPRVGTDQPTVTASTLTSSRLETSVTDLNAKHFTLEDFIYTPQVNDGLGITHDEQETLQMAYPKETHMTGKFRKVLKPTHLMEQYQDIRRKREKEEAEAIETAAFDARFEEVEAIKQELIPTPEVSPAKTDTSHLQLDSAYHSTSYVDDVVSAEPATVSTYDLLSGALSLMKNAITSPAIQQVKDEDLDDDDPDDDKPPPLCTPRNDDSDSEDDSVGAQPDIAESAGAQPEVAASYARVAASTERENRVFAAEALHGLRDPTESFAVSAGLDQKERELLDQEARELLRKEEEQDSSEERQASKELDELLADSDPEQAVATRLVRTVQDPQAQFAAAVRRGENEYDSDVLAGNTKLQAVPLWATTPGIIFQPVEKGEKGTDVTGYETILHELEESSTTPSASHSSDSDWKPPAALKASVSEWSTPVSNKTRRNAKRDKKKKAKKPVTKLSTVNSICAVLSPSAYAVQPSSSSESSSTNRSQFENPNSFEAIQDDLDDSQGHPDDSHQSQDFGEASSD